MAAGIGRFTAGAGDALRGPDFMAEISVASIIDGVFCTAKTSPDDTHSAAVSFFVGVSFFFKVGAGAGDALRPNDFVVGFGLSVCLNFSFSTCLIAMSVMRLMS